MALTPSEIGQRLDAFYEEIATTGQNPELTVHDLPYVTAVMARWEAIHDEASHLLFTLRKQHQAASMAFRNAMRESMSKPSTLMAGATYDERRAKWETAHLNELKQAEAYEFILDSLKDFLEYLRRRIFWLRGLQIDARELDKRKFYQSSNDVFSEG